MKVPINKALSARMAVVAGIGALLFLAACRRSEPPVASTVSAASTDALAWVLAKHEGNSRTDQEIRRFQDLARAGRHDASLERLGWLFVAKARESFDPGYYKLAEACAEVMGAAAAGSPEAMLLRGHVLHSLHRFKQAEAIARELVQRRGLSFDYALLGDALMEQGKTSEAIVAYQKMLDLRPDLHSCSRAAHMRWLKGDLDGAIELMCVAVSAASPRDASSAAWVYTRLAGYRFQQGSVQLAEKSCAMALESVPDYPPALLLRGRILLFQEKPQASLEPLRRAAELNPLPEYQWALADALRAADRSDEAAVVEHLLERDGAASDPRTFAMYLATSGRDASRALRLARDELSERSDVFTHDALAWALAASGDWEEAGARMSLALVEGTRDARLQLHAGIIAARLNRTAAAEKHLKLAAESEQTLFPSERRRLHETLAQISATVTCAEQGCSMFNAEDEETRKETQSFQGFSATLGASLCPLR